MVSSYLCLHSQLNANTCIADEKISALLELYNVPFTADMFLHDKKLAYLRFVGASRVLMHLVLD